MAAGTRSELEETLSPGSGGLIPADATSRRSRAISSLALSEDSSRPGLDRLTRLAQMLFDVPISSVTIIDDARAYHPSVVGLPRAAGPSEQTFCETVVRTESPLEVPDAGADGRFAHLDAVRDGTLRFYAGRPLRDPDGNVLGSFCIMDHQPRALDDHQAAALEELAALAEHELLASYEDAAVSAIQTVLQPGCRIVTDGWRVEGVCVPALAAGGDFCDCLVEEDTLTVVLGDVMGKGTTAALLGATVRGTVRGAFAGPREGRGEGLLDAAGSDGSLASSFALAASMVSDDLERAGAFATAFVARVDRDTGQVRYVDAGSGLALVRRADGAVEQLAGTGMPLGVPGETAWPELVTTLDPGDRMLLCSDGLLDLLADQTAWHRLAGDLLARHEDPRELAAEVSRLTDERTGIDDVTVVAVYRGEAR